VRESPPFAERDDIVATGGFLPAHLEESCLVQREERIAYRLAHAASDLVHDLLASLVEPEDGGLHALQRKTESAR
jgi:hypothetical protein